jgi:hypothetical protein
MGAKEEYYMPSWERRIVYILTAIICGVWTYYAVAYLRLFVESLLP